MLKTETYGFMESASGRLLTNEEASDTSIFTDNSSFKMEWYFFGEVWINERKII